MCAGSALWTLDGLRDEWLPDRVWSSKRKCDDPSGDDEADQRTLSTMHHGSDGTTTSVQAVAPGEGGAWRLAPAGGAAQRWRGLVGLASGAGLPRDYIGEGAWRPAG